MDTLDLWRQHGAFLEGHFVLSSGLHSSSYFQAALVLRYPWIARRLGSELADLFEDFEIDLVIGPAMGGIIIAHEVAGALKKPAIFAERPKGVFELRRGFRIEAGERALIVEDVVTTGTSFLETARLVESSGAEVAGAGCIVYRGRREDPEFPYEFRSLVRFCPDTWSPAECPLCRQKIPLEKPGSRKEKY